MIEDRGRGRSEDGGRQEGDEEQDRAAAEDMLKERGLYYLPEVPEEPEGEAQGPPEFDWRDIIAFIVASYQIIFPFLGAVVLIFLVIWGVLWLLS